MARLGYPKDSFSTTINYSNDRLSLFSNLNYTGPVTQGVDEADNFREHQRIKSFMYVNSGFRFDVGERYRFFGSIDNVFDRKPPFPVPAFGGSVTYFPGVLGVTSGLERASTSRRIAVEQNGVGGHRLPTLFHLRERATLLRQGVRGIPRDVGCGGPTRAQATIG